MPIFSRRSPGSNPTRGALKFTSEATGFEYRQFLTLFNKICSAASENQLKKLIKIASQTRRRKYKHGDNRPKYGNMNKAFTDYELKKFFDVIKNPKHYLLFQYQANLGLRIGEAVKLNIQDINPHTRELRIYAPKTQRTDYLLIPEGLFHRSLAYYEKHQEEIKEARGSLFNLDENYARRIFREYCDKADLCETYGMAEESIREQRKLYRLTTHSLRHYAITKFYNTTKDLEAARMFARHTRSGVTDKYIHKTKEEVYRIIDLAFK